MIMKFIKPFVITLSLMLCVLSGCRILRAPDPVRSIKDSGESAVKQFKLANNMPVLIVEESDSRVVTLDCWINTGSAAEPKDISGVSHFLEHMLFKGTSNRGVGEIDREIEAVGGMWNGGTSMEFTHYYLTVAAPFASTGLGVLHDVIANSLLDPEELERERQVILEEYYRQQDDPSDFLYTEAVKNSFLQSPCMWPVLGTPETINAITRDRMVQYYQERYAPENMVLIIVGGVTAMEILPEVEKTFGTLNRPYVPPAESAEPTIRREGHHVEYERPVRESYLVITLPAPDITRRQDVYAMDVLSGILGDGRSSRLHENIKEQKNLVSSIAAFYPTARTDGLFYITATLDYARKDDVLKAIFEEIRAMIDEKPKRAEMQKAVRMITSNFAFSHEKSSGRSSELGFYHTLTGDVQFEQTYLEMIEGVTPEDVRAVAARYLNPQSANIFIIKPAEEAE